MKGLIAMLATIWRLAAPYFRSEDRLAGRVLLASVIGIELANVALSVMLNTWNNRFYNALQDKNWDAFVSELLFFCGLATAFIVFGVYQLYLNQWLQIRWRRWMTRHYLSHWLTDANHYRMQLLGDAADNPDQRIAQDIQLFIELTLTIGIGLLSSIVTLGSFTVILWTLSNSAPLVLFGTAYDIPGYLFWAALLYSLVGTVLTHLIGWRLAGLNFNQQRLEADFRFNLVRTRLNSEQIALLSGEPAEEGRLLDRFGRLVDNWYAIMTRQKKLNFFTNGFSQVSIIFPFIVVSPAYFAGAAQLGGLMQTASAFGSVQGAMSFFVTAYRQLAEWSAVISRLDGFDAAVMSAQAAAHTPPLVEVTMRDSATALEIDNMLVRLPQGTPLVSVDDIVIKAGEHVLVTGPSGSGKSTMFRAIAGKWPFGSGDVIVPQGAKLMALPQRPYFPIATLAAAVTYPAEAGTFSGAQLADVITAVGLPGLASRIGEEEAWDRMLSPGEQQRLGIARAILHAPDYLLLDEATASLDEAAEAGVYRLLLARLPRTTIVSIGHRSTLAEFHQRRLNLVREGDRSRVVEAKLAPAAE